MLEKENAHWIYLDMEKMGKEGNPRDFIYSELKDYLIKEKKVKYIDGKVVKVNRDEKGNVKSVYTDNQSEINGDLFVNKAPAGTIGDLAQALKEMFNAKNSVKIIGTRHGEKLYETLCTREEMTKAEDMGEFYRIPADNRDLNYARYFSEGEEDISKVEDYHSHNTQQCDVEGMKSLLNKLPLIKEELKEIK